MAADPSYAVKRISFLGHQNVPILCQNANGPCPLLAIANALFLLRRVTLHPDAQSVNTGELISIVGGYILERASSIHDPERAAYQQAQLDDVMRLLPGLGEGLDVNVRFGDVEGFEASPALSVFDLAGVRLVHGWTVCPETEPEAAVALSGLSFNTAQDLMARAQSPAHSQAAGEGGGGAAAGAAAPSSDGDAAAVPPPPSAEAEAPGDAAAEPPSLTAEPPAPDAAASLDAGSSAEAPAPASPVASLPARDAPPAEAPAPPAAVPPIASPPAGDAPPRPAHPSSAALLPGGVSISLVADWLEATRSQLTAAGLRGLSSVLHPLEIAVLFRNCHFATVMRFSPPPHGAPGGAHFAVSPPPPRLLTLVTDLGYAEVPQVVWESLDEGSLSGDTRYFGAAFRPSVVPQSPPPLQRPAPLPLPQYVAPAPAPLPPLADYTFATLPEPPARPAAPPPAHAESDFELALRLQREEEEGAAAAPPPMQRRGAAPPLPSVGRVERPPDYDGLSPEEQAHLDAALRISSGQLPPLPHPQQQQQQQQQQQPSRPQQPGRLPSSAASPPPSPPPPEPRPPQAGRHDRLAQSAGVLREAAAAREQRARGGGAAAAAQRTALPTRSGGGSAGGHDDRERCCGPEAGGKKDGCCVM